MHSGGLDDDQKDSAATHITLRPQLGGHRQCGLAICTFHLGFSLVDLCFPTSQNQRRISRDLLPRAIRTLQSLEEAKELQIRGGTGRWQVLPPTPRTRAELE